MQLHQPKPGDAVSIALCGIGGYGEWYIRALLAENPAQPFRLVGLIDPHPGQCSLLPLIQAARIPVFESLEDFYSKLHCDLLILATPIHLHCLQTCLALAQGSHVLCEKPLCVSLDQIQVMERAEAVTGKTVSIGYQWSFSRAIHKLKEDRLNGRFGAARRLRTIVCWPRDEAYYRRNQWAGRQQLDPDVPILDSPVNNAAAHHLHNMFYLLGSEPSRSALPLRVEADLWRANPIENYDTAALRIGLEGDCEAFFYTSHATSKSEGPSFIYEFERAVVEYDVREGNIVARFHDGSIVDYGSPEADPHEKIWHAIDSAKTGEPSLCGIVAATAHTICVNRAQLASGGVHDFPRNRILEDHSGASPRRYVENLQEILGNCFREGKLLRENEAFLEMVAPSTAKPKHVSREEPTPAA